MRSSVRPVLRYPAPSYPDWDLVVAEPALLARALPRRWVGKKGLTAALVAAALGAGGCGGGGATAGGGEKAKARPVAVVFAHGDGRSSFGCVSVAAPMYLTEADARQVIEEELAKAGVRPDRGGLRIPRVVRSRVPDDWREEDDFSDPDTWGRRIGREVGPPHDVVLDGYDKERRIGYKFISPEFDRLGGYDAGAGSTANEDNHKEAAKYVASRLNRRGGESAIGVFYDPIAYVDLSKLHAQRWLPFRLNSEEAKSFASGEVLESKEKLRAQVRDFAEWLKAQGLLR